MRRKKEEMEEVEEIEESQESEKELKKKEREAKKEKRLKRKKQDKAARWAGAVMLFLIMIIGFLLWISGQLTTNKQDYVRPVASPYGAGQLMRGNSLATPTGKVIVK